MLMTIKNYEDNLDIGYVSDEDKTLPNALLKLFQAPPVHLAAGRQAVPRTHRREPTTLS
jgi:hypothetical protein